LLYIDNVLYLRKKLFIQNKILILIEGKKRLRQGNINNREIENKKVDYRVETKSKFKFTFSNKNAISSRYFK